MSERALSFGRTASAYERYRPGYPDELVDVVLAYAATTVRTALEIGAGTGKATRVFAARDIDVTATEPDAAMLAELRRHVPATVRTEQASFEELTPTRTYDLVYAAAALHWTQPAGRWARVRSLLGPHGVFASFGGPLDLADADLEEAVRAARGDDLADDGFPTPDGTPDDGSDDGSDDRDLEWPGTELVGSDLFTDVRQVRIERRLRLSGEEYVGHLSTISAYLQLSPHVRELVLGRILRVLPPQVDLVGDLTLHLACPAP